ncbi:hypothetical protein CFIMG_003937RAa [Ceratocystis fimbriata CBS 114723]|uniref:Uncharacterized protein n=1 Tax=Ceratocystis fimbriata CBS 114723 TaxID=1035309 RepID=A0A2C5XGF2_9PEZI|nr:hypothetical protein CFIMG_003937RAa [Ceratocystis fimbriata CBS 114723]
MSAVISASNMSLYAALRHMEAQNQAVREAWESERKYLEANRARAEEVYMEERSIMDEAVNLMETERDQLLEEIYKLRNNVRHLESENGVLRQRLGLDSSISLLMDGNNHPVGLRGGADSSDSILLSPLKPATDDASLVSQSQLQPHPQLRTTSALLSPAPVQGPVAPMDFLATKRSSVPTIDIHEIHPELEGIPIKATAIKSPTFTDIEPAPLSAETCIKPFMLETPAEDGSHTDPDLDGDQDVDTEASTLKSPSSDHMLPHHGGGVPPEDTLQMLAVHESVRLKIHAGHTPNHSLSKFPSFTAATCSTTGANTVNGPTPNHCYETPAALGNPTVFDITQTDSYLSGDNSKAINNASQDPVLAATRHTIADAEDFEGTLMPPKHDQPLTGPLMITNIPAKDEIFLAKLSEKLEAVKISREASPESLTHSENDDQSQFAPPPLPVPVAEAEKDAAIEENTEAGAEPESKIPKSDKWEYGAGGRETSKRPRAVADLVDEDGDDEPDIPLRFKKTTNFGLPMGQSC